jgi:hypothetical protein
VDAVEVLRVIAAILLVFFVPGYFLTKTLFPRPREFSDELPEVYTVAFSMCLSIAVTILTGIMLAMLPPDPVTGLGYFQLPYIVAMLLTASAVFAVAAWWRGAFPGLARFSARFERRPTAPPDGTGVADDPKRYWKEQDLLARRLELRAQARRLERTGRGSREEKSYYQRRKAEVTQELVALDDELAKLRTDREAMVEKAEAEAVKQEARRRERRDALLRFLRLKRGESS